MSELEKESTNNFVYPLIFLGLFVLLIGISAEVDWFWNGGLHGTIKFKELAYVWLFVVLMPLLLIFGWLLMKKFPKTGGDPMPIEGDRNKFIWSIIFILVMQNMVPIFYLLFNRDEFFIDLVIAVLMIINFISMSAMAAFFPIHSESSARNKRWLIFFLFAVLPFYILVGVLIGVTWIVPDLKIIYWIVMWGLVLPMSFVFLGMSWKNGGGNPRKAFNIAFAGIIMQYSFLEDFFFYALNGQPQPAGGYEALLHFPLDISRLFGHQGVALTPTELLIWMIIMLALAALIVLDVPFLVYKKLRNK